VICSQGTLYFPSNGIGHFVSSLSIQGHRGWHKKQGQYILTEGGKEGHWIIHTVCHCGRVLVQGAVERDTENRQEACPSHQGNPRTLIGIFHGTSCSPTALHTFIMWYQKNPDAMNSAY
jgi:hypothetical protein